MKEWVLEGYAEKLQTDLPVTEINATDIQITASNQALPAAIIIGEDRIPPTEIIDNDKLAEFDPEEDGIDFFESMEGMLVGVNDPKVVALQKYGELNCYSWKYGNKYNRWWITYHLKLIITLKES